MEEKHEQLLNLPYVFFVNNILRSVVRRIQKRNENEYNGTPLSITAIKNIYKTKMMSSMNNFTVSCKKIVFI